MDVVKYKDHNVNHHYQTGEGTILTPDRLFVSEWRLRMLYNQEPQYTWTMYGGTLFVTDRETHNNIYRKYRMSENGFDGRLFMRSRFFTFWWQEELGDWTWRKRVKQVVEKFRSGDFFSDDCTVEPLDVSSWTFLFTGVVDGLAVAVRCTYDELLECGIPPIDTTNSRFMMGRRPLAKCEDPRMISYRDNCKYWKDRIGNMDVAEWRLLMYEE